jgi:predicted Rossmann fold nucleotide-binding protein DprA/Smf involved in DNA uptake
MSDLVALARKFVSLNDEIESVREQIKLAVANCWGGKAEAPFAQPARQSSGGSQPNHLQAAKEAESQILELLRTRPMRMAEISASMGAKQVTTGERLKRMKAKGLIEREDGGGAWTVVASP